MFTQPVFTSTTSLDFAETNPAVMVRAGNFTDADRPNDSARRVLHRRRRRTGSRAASPAGSTAAARSPRPPTAAGSSGRRVTPGSRSSTRSASATRGAPSTGIPANAKVESDRVNPNKFYGFAAGKFYVSTNGGRASPPPPRPACPPPAACKFKAVPGTEGDIWLAGGEPPRVSASGARPNSGASFTKLASVDHRGQRRLRQGGARADVPGGVRGRQGRRA